MTKSAASRPRPIVIAHRGASGYAPEHTLEAYELAVLQGADFVEPDLVSTKDGVLIARHDNTLGATTDVAQRPEFSARRTTRTVDGLQHEDSWFSEDFTLAEIKQLRAVERIAQIRPQNAALDGRFEIPTFEEIIALVRHLEKREGRTIGIYPETKHPSHFAGLGLAMEAQLVELLERHGYATAAAPVFIQSFETSNLRALAKLTALPLIQLLWLEGQPYDVRASGGGLTYDDMATRQGLAEIASYAGGVGPEKNHFILPCDPSGHLDAAGKTTFVDDAHAVGLLVHPYTFRAENAFLPWDYRSDSPEAPRAREHGRAAAEIAAFLRLGIDGFFIDHPDVGVRARDAFKRRSPDPGASA